jgi:hypothetical protein
MDNDVVIFTGCDANYFSLCCDLLASIENAFGFLPRIRILDVGLLPDQARMLAEKIEKVIQPGWDLGAGMNLPLWYRAMTARPFLPNYAGDAAIICWLDCDAWVQTPAPLAALVHAARDGRLAIVEEHFGKGFTIMLAGDVPGTARRRTYSSQTVKANIRACYELCFGPNIAAAYGDLPCFNVGVFALRTDSPSWAVWRHLYAPALARHYHFMVEQQALNVAIRSGAVPTAPQPWEANYTCHMELPWYAADKGVFTIPGDEKRVLGVIHLCDTKKYKQLPIPHFPYGLSNLMPLDYGAFRQFVADGRS